MKSQKIIYLFYVVTAIFVASCRKEDPQPASNSSSTSSTSAFSFKGNVEGNPILIEGGFNNYYMSTSFSKDENGVYNYIGELKAKGCETGCSNSLKISIKDYRKSAGLTSKLDSIFTAGYYSIATPGGTPSKYSNLFIGGMDNGIAKSYTWDFGDGNSVVQTSPYVEHNYMHPGIYPVTLTSESLDGCLSEETKYLQCGQTGNTFLSDYTETIIGDTIIFIPLPMGGIPPYSYLWDFGDGTFSEDASPRHSYPTPGVYKTSLVITDLFGSTSFQNSKIPINAASTCSSFIILPNPKGIDNPMNLGAVEIEWTDGNGEIWKSNHLRQATAGSSFKITSVAKFINNQDGYPTIKIRAQISCTLYNGFKSLTIRDGEVDFAFAYK